MQSSALTSIIIDDEPDARQSLQFLLTKHCPEIDIIDTAEGVSCGLQMIEKVKPQVVFLDIKMQDGTGFELLDQCPNPSFQVIFTTAHDDFALKAFRYHAIDYLLKPIDPKELYQTIHLVHKRIHQQAFQQQQLFDLLENSKASRFDKLTLSTSEGLVFLKVEDIIYLQSEGNYTFFVTQQGEKIMVSKTIKNYEEILPSEKFHRIHQSYLLNLSYLKKFLKEEGGMLLLTNGEKLPVSRRKKEGLLKLLTS